MCKKQRADAVNIGSQKESLGCDKDSTLHYKSPAKNGQQEFFKNIRKNQALGCRYE
jgi:hypothetical protein